MLSSLPTVVLKALSRASADRGQMKAWTRRPPPQCRCDDAVNGRARGSRVPIQIVAGKSPA